MVAGKNGFDIPATYLNASNSTGPGEPAKTLGDTLLESILWYFNLTDIASEGSHDRDNL